MTDSTQPFRPEDVTTITPYLTVHDGAAAIDFYKRAFGAEERYRMANDAGIVEHATLQIGDATVYLSDELGGMQSARTLGGSPVTMHMYVPDCDAVWAQALAAGATEVTPMADQEWSDRYGLLRDPFGHLWGISTMKSSST